MEKHVLIEDKESDWLQICMEASSLNLKGNQAILR